MRMASTSGRFELQRRGGPQSAAVDGDTTASGRFELRRRGGPRDGAVEWAHLTRCTRRDTTCGPSHADLMAETKGVCRAKRAEREWQSATPKEKAPRCAWPAPAAALNSKGEADHRARRSMEIPLPAAALNSEGEADHGTGRWSGHIKPAAPGGTPHVGPPTPISRMRLRAYAEPNAQSASGKAQLRRRRLRDAHGQHQRPL